MVNMSRRQLLLTAALMGSAGGRSALAEARGKPQFGNWGFDITAMDLSVGPGQDFNRYASGAWLARTAIPGDQSIVSLRTLMTDRIEMRLHEIMKEAATSSPSVLATLKDKVGAFYKAFMDENRLES